MHLLRPDGSRGRDDVTVESPIAEGRRRGAVRMQVQVPAPPVDGDLVVEQAQQAAVVQAGRSALCSWDQMVDLAGRGTLVAAWERAVFVTGDDGPAQVGRDGLRGLAEVEGQADAGRRL